MIWTLVGVVCLVAICASEWCSARTPIEPTHSPYCTGSAMDENCAARSHFTREDIQFLDSFDSQIGFKP